MKIFVKSGVLLFAIACMSLSAAAQFDTVYLGINGLTCSQCSRSVEMQLRKLSFVADVKMDLQRTNSKIILKKGARADVDKIAQSVVNAGFSVRSLEAGLYVGNEIKQNSGCLSYDGDNFVFTKPPSGALAGRVKLQFIGKKFQSKNEYRKMEPYMKATCGNDGGNIYHVSIAG